MTLIPHALQTVFRQKTYLLGAAITAGLMFTTLILLPVGRLSAPAFYYQITSLDMFSVFTITFFSLTLGTLLAMNVHLILRKIETHKRIGNSFLSIIASFFAGIFGSSVCVACLTLLLGFLGLPTITFLIVYKKSFFYLTAAIALIQLYLTSRAIITSPACKTCMIHREK